LFINADDAYAFVENNNYAEYPQNEYDNSNGFTPITDFRYDLTNNGAGVTILQYTGLAADVVVPSEIEGYPVLETGEQAFTRSVLSNLSPVSSVVLPQGLRKIGKRAFLNTGIVWIEIPDTVIEIGEEAFSRSQLGSIEIPGSVRTIGDGAFSHCRLVRVSIPETVTEIGGLQFLGSPFLEIVHLPDSMTEIGTLFFEDCTNLQSVNFPKNLQRIASSAFSGCRSLRTIEIPDEIQRVTFDSNTIFAASWTNLPLATRKKLQDLGYRP
jgi:hypothetical protein